MARSLLRQLEQIRRAATYDDVVVDVNTSAVAEPTVSGSLEEDTNVIRTLIKQLKGTPNWYDALPTYTDPGAIGTPKSATLTNIAGNTLDAKTIILAVSATNSDQGYTVSGTSTGVLLVPTTTNYADATDLTGLPIFASTTNSGTFADLNGNDTVCRIDVINNATDSEMQTNDGHTVYAKFHDGEDFGGDGEGTDVYARFYANGVAIDLSTVSGSVNNVSFIYPLRKKLSDMQEYEWLRTDFVSSWEGDIELIEDIQDLWSFTGSSDGTEAPTWTNTSASYLLSSNPSTLKSAIDLINTGVGNRDFTEANYLTDGSSITAALDTLDQELKDLEESINAGIGEKYVESVSTAITKNTPHSLPYSIIFTPEDTAGREGKNMDVFVDGQLLAADTGANGANADRDYGETSTGSITFRFDIQIGRNITYIVRQ